MADFKLNLSLNLQNFKSGLNEVKGGLQGAFDGAQGALQKIGQSFSAFTDKFKDAMKVASDAAAGDELGDVRFARVFGEASEAAGQFADNTARAFGRTAGDVKTFLSQLKFTTDQLGFAAKESTDLSQRVGQLALNLADFAGISDSEAVGASQQALIGNTRGLKQFGIVLDESAEKEKAFQLGLNPEALTDQEAAMVRLQLITEKLGTTAGASADAHKTFSGALRDLKSSFSELQGDIGKTVNDLLKPLIVVATDVVNRIRDWIKENPRLAQGIITVSIALAGIAAVIAGLIGSVASIVGFFTALSTVLTAIAAAGGTAAVATGLFAVAVSALSGAVEVLLAAAGAVLLPLLLLIGAAIAGWKFGTAIREWLGLGDAMENAAKAAERANFKKLTDTFKQGSPELAAYNRLIKEGVADYKAAILAADERNELAFREEQVRRGEKTDLERLAELRLRHADAVNKENDARKGAVPSIKEMQAAQDRLKDSEKDYLKLTQDNTRDLIKLRQGEAEASIFEAQREQEGRRKIFEQRFADELTLVRGFEDQKQQILNRPTQNAGDAAALKNIEDQIALHVGKLQQIQNDAITNEQRYNENLRKLSDDRLKEIDDAAKKRIDAVKAESDAVIRELDEEIAATTRQIDRMKSIRDQGHADAQRFIKQMDDAALRRKDSGLADIQSIKEAAAQALKGAQNEEERAQILQRAKTAMAAVADMSAEINRLTKENNDLWTRATLAHNQHAQEESRIAADAAEKNEQLNKVKEKQSERDEALTKSAEELAEISKDSANDQLLSDDQLKSLQDDLKVREKEKRDEFSKQLTAIKAITSEWEIQKQQARERLGIEAQITTEVLKRTPGAQNAASTTTAGSTSSSSTSSSSSAEETQGQGSAFSETIESLKAVIADISVSFTEKVNQLSNAASEFLRAAVIFPQIIGAFDQLVAAQNFMTSTIADFGSAMLDKMTAQTDELNSQGGKLADITSRVRAIEIKGHELNDLSTSGL